MWNEEKKQKTENTKLRDTENRLVVSDTENRLVVSEDGE